MVRESRNEDDAYTLSLCHDQKIKNFRIVRSSEDGMLSLKDPEGSEDGSSHEEGEEHLVFHTIRELIERHFHRKVRLVWDIRLQEEGVVLWLELG